MNGVQRFLPGNTNHIRNGATITGPVKPIVDAVIQRAVSRNGSAGAEIKGTYVGAEERIYEIEVLDTTPTEPLVTKPTFSGTGNGDLTDIEVPAAISARTYTVELADLGQQLLAAGADFQGVKLKARTAGAAGNGLSLRISRTGLTFTPQPFSLLHPLAQGLKEAIGPEFDYDTKTLSADNIVPADAHRVVFGQDFNNIYVQYKKFENGEFIYFFEPAIKTPVDEGSQVSFVTGTYTVEVLDGVTVEETYNDIRTLYDLLNALKTQSTLVSVEGVVANNREPGGNNVSDLQARTDAYVATNTGQSSEYATGFTDVVLADDAATQLLTARCIAATAQDDFTAGAGSEIWEVKSSIGNLLGTYRSGDLVVTPSVTARIPRKLPPGYTSTPQGQFDLVDIVYADRDDEVPKYPGICVNGRTLGPNAVAQTVTLTYTKRAEPDECACTESPFSLNPECIGSPVPTDGGPTVGYQSDVVTKLIDLYDWLADTVRANSTYFSAPGSYIDPSVVGSTPGSVQGNMAFAQQDPFISNPMAGGSYNVIGYDNDGQPIYRQISGPSMSGFAKQTLLAVVGDFERAIGQIDKTAGALRTAGLAAWDAAVTEFKTDVDDNFSGTPLGESEIVESTEDLNEGELVVVYKSGGDKFVKKAVAHPAAVGYGFVKADTTSGADATVYYYGELPEIAEVSLDGAPDLTPCTTSDAYPVTIGTALVFSACTPGLPQVATVDGISNRILGAPVLWPLESGVTPYKLYIKEGDTAFAIIGLQLLPDRYKTRLMHCLISAGISPLGKSDANSESSGDGCWQDTNDPYYWTVNGSVGGTYAPAFNNQAYYSSKKRPASPGVAGSTGYTSTKEFGFYLHIPCVQYLEEGDQIILEIGNAAQGKQSYVKGDLLTLGIIAAQNIQFGGGADGDNVQTWYVTDSVDGPLPVYELDLDTPAPYVDGDFTFLIEEGSIPFVKGDSFSFSVEGGHFRWRHVIEGVAGVWSSAIAATTTPITLEDGLELTFQLGTSPAFFTGDVYKFLALQPYAIKNILLPDFDAWRWGNSTAPLLIDLGAVKDITAISLAYHDIPEGATIVVTGGNVAVNEWAETLTWQKDVMAKLVNRTARYLSVSVTGADDAGIGYLYIGETIAFTYSAQVSLNREYRVKRSTGDVNPNAQYQGVGLGGSVQWPEGSLTEEDFPAIKAMVDFLKKNNDEPLLFFPQYTREDEIVLASVEVDEITFNDVYNFQPNYDRERRISCSLPLRGVIFQ